MADSPIGSLSPIAQIFDGDSFVLEQNGEARRVTGQQLRDFIDIDILTVSVVDLDSNQNATVSYSHETGHMTLGIPRGVGISSIMSDENGHFIIYFTDGTSWTSATVKGDKGDKGDTGKSAYEYACDGGYSGTEAEYTELMAAVPQGVSEASYFFFNINDQGHLIETVSTNAEQEMTFSLVNGRLIVTYVDAT